MGPPSAERGEGNARGGWPARIGRVETALFRVESWICLGSLAVMMLAVFATVLVRNLNLGLPNYGEYALVAMLPLTFVGGALCTYHGAHIAIDVLQSVENQWLRRAAEFTVAAGTLIFAAIFFYSGVYVLSEVWESGEQMLDLGTPLVVPVAFVPLGMALMLFHSLSRLLRTIFPGAFGPEQETS